MFHSFSLGIKAIHAKCQQDLTGSAFFFRFLLVSIGFTRPMASAASLRSFSTTRTWQHRVQRIQGRRSAEQVLDLDGRQGRLRLRLLRGLDGIPWEQWWSCLEEGYWLLGNIGDICFDGSLRCFDNGPLFHHCQDVI